MGCIKAPLFNIELCDVIADELHLLLRVMDVLIQALLDTAVAYDHHTSRGHRKRVKAPDGPMVLSLIEAIKTCGVNFYVYEDKKDKQGRKGLQWPSLMGDEKRKVLKTLPSKITNKCQPPNLVDKVIKLWKVCRYIDSCVSIIRSLFCNLSFRILMTFTQ